MNGDTSLSEPVQVRHIMPAGLAEALTVRAKEIGLSRSELLRRLAASFTGYKIGTELETK